MTCLDFTHRLVVMLNRVNSVSFPNHLRMEASVLVSGVVYSAGGAICFKQLVVAFDFIAVTFLSLLLDVVSVWILHSILELVLGMALLERMITMLERKAHIAGSVNVFALTFRHRASSM